jgi:hypothetical protein
MDDQRWPPAGLDLAQLREAAREIAPSVKPVFQVEQGSRGLRQIGVNFIIRYSSGGAIVTAEGKVVARSEGNATKWPPQYRVIDGKESTASFVSE